MSSISYKDPSPSKLNKKAISHLAGKFAGHVGYFAGGDLELVVEKAGGKIKYQDFWDLDTSNSGSIQVEPDQQFVVFVANHTAKTRDRFTIAHEIGHFVLHFLLPRANSQDLTWGLKASRFGTGQTESEANCFAASFLMPEVSFADIFRQMGGDIADVADHFGVSLSAVSVRAKELRLE